MKRFLKAVLLGSVFLFGVGVAFGAALLGAIGPEPPITVLGKVVSVVYYPYFKFFCDPLDMVGFILALVLHGLIFVVLIYYGLKWIEKTHAKKRTEPTPPMGS